MIEVSELNVYPVKSLGGFKPRSAAVHARGFRDDRRWMLVDPEGRFLTQREFPMMATIRAEIDGNSLRFMSRSGELQIDSTPSGHAIDVEVWDDRCRAEVFEDRANRWFSEMLGADCRLVRIDPDFRRRVDPEFAVTADDNVSFADAFPYLLIGTASLADLNARLDSPVPMDRFRPNIVVSGSSPFDEDDWKRIRIGDTFFRAVKQCGRCVMTTIDQESGEKMGVEPLRTLGAFRTVERNGKKKILFGQNMIAENPGGEIRVGDAVEIID